MPQVYLVYAPPYVSDMTLNYPCLTGADDTKYSGKSDKEAVKE